MNDPIRKMTIEVYQLTCQRCGKEWIPVKKLAEVRMCPKCKSAWWDTPKK